MDVPLVLSLGVNVISVFCLYTTRNKTKKTTWFSKLLQVSKLITMILLLMHLITWLVVLVMVVRTNDVNNLPILTSYTSDVVSSVMPYFTLTCVERVTNSDVITKITTVLKKGA